MIRIYLELFQAILGCKQGIIIFGASACKPRLLVFRFKIIEYYTHSSARSVCVSSRSLKCLG